VRERIISLPQRAASIRLASEAESAAIAAPFMNRPGSWATAAKWESSSCAQESECEVIHPVDDFTAEAARGR